MRAAVALMLCSSLLATACFPKEPQKRLYAQLTEGGSLASGIVLLTFAGTGANCDANRVPGQVSTEDCHSHEGTVGALGLGLIILGLVGFIATVSSAEDDDKPAVVVTPPPTPVGSGSGSGSAH